MLLNLILKYQIQFLIAFTDEKLCVISENDWSKILEKGDFSLRNLKGLLLEHMMDFDFSLAEV